MGAVALIVGVGVLLLTLASQTGLLGGQNFAVVALVGAVGAVLCLGIAMRTRARAAVVGLSLSLLPVLLLVYYLLTSDG